MAAPEGNAGGTQPVITVDIATAVGPIFIANLLNWLLMGTLIMQVYTYYRRFAKDRTWIRVLVAVLFSLDIAHTCLLTAHGWFFTIEIWGQFDRLDEIPWSAEMIPFMCGLVSCIVQLFYAWRIWVLSSKYKFLRLLAVLVVMLSLMQGLSAMIAAIILLINSDQQNLLRLHPAFSVWLAGSFVTDIMITSSMSYILYKAKEASKWAGSETMLTRMINNTIQTGAVTVVCALIDLVLFTKYIQTTYHQVPAYVLGKLYSNSLMLNLNLRKPQTSTSSNYPHSTGASDTLPMHYFRSTRDASYKVQESSRSTAPGEMRSTFQTSQSVIQREDSSEAQGSDLVKWKGDAMSHPAIPKSVNIKIHTATETKRSSE